MDYQKQEGVEQLQIIQVDIDPIEIGRNYPVEVGIVGDAAAVGQQLINAITSAAPEGNIT